MKRAIRSGFARGWIETRQQFTEPGDLTGMNIAYLGFATVAALLVTDREDGTLLRAKLVPNGMIGYFTAKIIDGSAAALTGLAVPIVYGVIFFHGLTVSGAGPPSRAASSPFPAFSTRSRTCRTGCSPSGRSSRSTGWRSARARRCCRTPWQRSRSVIRGGRRRPPPCSSGGRRAGPASPASRMTRR